MKHKIVPQIKTWMSMSLSLIFIFTISVYSGGVSEVQAQSASGLASSYETETEDAGALASMQSFVAGIVSWVVKIVGNLMASVNALFGFERGEGSQAMFGGVFYFFLILVLLFSGKLLYNIMRDTLKSVVPKGMPNRPPRFRGK